MSRATQWTYNMVCFSTFFYSYEEKHRSKATAKKYTKAYHIIRSLCRSTHLESNTIGFSILWFLCDLLWFFKTAFGGNLTGFEKFRGWYRPFYRLGGYVVHPHSWGGDIDFFPQHALPIHSVKDCTNWVFVCVFPPTQPIEHPASFAVLLEASCMHH